MSNLKSWIFVVYFMLILLAHQRSATMASSIGHTIMEIAAGLENDFVSNGMSYVRNANDISVLVRNDIIIDDLKRIWINCNTSHNTFSFGMD